MKFLITFGFILFFGWLTISIKAPAKNVAVKATAVLDDTIHFASQVQPILVKNCSPCHFPGGKMYQRMPFDKDTTIINHQAGILKRIKGDENTLIRSFLQQQQN